MMEIRVASQAEHDLGQHPSIDVDDVVEKDRLADRRYDQIQYMPLCLSMSEVVASKIHPDFDAHAYDDHTQQRCGNPSANPLCFATAVFANAGIQQGGRQYIRHPSFAPQESSTDFGARNSRIFDIPTCRLSTVKASFEWCKRRRKMAGRYNRVGIMGPQGFLRYESAQWLGPSKQKYPGGLLETLAWEIGIIVVATWTSCWGRSGMALSAVATYEGVALRYRLAHDCYASAVFRGWG
ncbi:hypothetical protein B0H67DRAFT_558703 [Lasiosphaeris hirsuta]|uniref:Uncharacterized protein n=1 Tax=Lasiosphaeris hirsuta TaxID=260670 RepID=A0AA40DFK3_9PEZI|nr:hypothetical protein B0H67DRAFT_558703 [Lasiosphaeris hirsuta]